MKELDIKITSVEVKAKTRKLRCEYSVEMAKDIEMYHGVDGLSDFRKSFRKESINNIFKISKHDK